MKGGDGLLDSFITCIPPELDIIPEQQLRSVPVQVSSSTACGALQRRRSGAGRAPDAPRDEIFSVSLAETAA